MTSKFAECTLGVKYRDIGPDGTVYGGPMYYLRKGLKLSAVSKGLRKSNWRLYLLLFCIGGSFGGGNAVSISNQASNRYLIILVGLEQRLVRDLWYWSNVMAFTSRCRNYWGRYQDELPL